MIIRIYKRGCSKMKGVSILVILLILVACNTSTPIEKNRSVEIPHTTIDTKLNSLYPLSQDTPFIDKTKICTPYVINTCVQGGSLKIYSGPGIEFEIFDSIVKDECVEILGISLDKHWVKIDRGWISSNFLEDDPQIGYLQILDENSAGETETLANPTHQTDLHPTNTYTPLPTPTIWIKPTILATDAPQSQLPPDAIIWNEAINHIGEQITVCGPILGAVYLSNTNGQPTFLDMGEKYPDPNRFTIIIWGNNRNKFPTEPESVYYEKDICVFGLIKYYKGMAELEVTNPSQITIQ